MFTAILLVALAAPGDSVAWISTRQYVDDLTGPQKTGIAALINADWGAGVAGGLDKETCTQDIEAGTFDCKVCRDDVSIDDDAYWDMRKTGKPAKKNGATQKCDTKTLSAERVAEYDDFTQAVFGVPMDEVFMFVLVRDGEEQPAVIHAGFNQITIGTKTAFRANDEAGLVHKPLEVVQ